MDGVLHVVGGVTGVGLVGYCMQLGVEFVSLPAMNLNLFWHKIIAQIIDVNSAFLSLFVPPVKYK